MDKDKSGFIDPHELKAVLLSTFNIDACKCNLIELYEPVYSSVTG